MFSRIAQSGYNAQTIVSEKLTSADSGEPLAIGIDIGGTAIKAAIVGVRGDLLETSHARLLQFRKRGARAGELRHYQIQMRRVTEAR